MATETFQISAKAAELYEANFVPALFAEWAPRTVAMAGTRPGDAVLDVACGTGVVARSAADVVGADGRVVGVDLNPHMLEVASRVRPDLEWRLGDVVDLPFEDAAFDVVTCQMAMMFFPDRRRALSEMARVVRPGGRIALCVPAGLDLQPAYGPFVDLAARLAGPDAISLLGAYWSCGDLQELAALAVSAGLAVTATRTRTGTARFASTDALVTIEVEGSPLASRITPETYAAVREGARQVLDSFVKDDGRLEAPLVCHLLGATKS